jgi:hypothetical protein
MGLKKIKQLSALLAFFISSPTFSQYCPGFQSGNPANTLITVNFYTFGGIFIKSCNCQLDGNAFKCGNCLPDSFQSYQYTLNGAVQHCSNILVLPVELLEYKATVSNGDVTISWTTETERDNAEFIVERSSDGVDYVAFQTVEGAGNSETLRRYFVLDSDPLKGTNYYRLSQRDVNGTLVRLAIVSADFSSILSGMVLAPNPARGQTSLQLPLHAPEQEFEVSITTSVGRTVQSFRTAEDMPLELPSGVYQVVARSGSQVWSEKLIVLD